MKIALDVMGGDYAPAEIIKGAQEAVKLYPYIEKIYLVGDQKQIQDYLQEKHEKLEIFHASEVIAMDEHPGIAYRKKKDASITVATKLVKDGLAHGVVSAGSTGAQMVAALFGLGRIKGVDRPAIGTVLPTLKGGKLLLDVGANADCKVQHLVQFAKMGSIYSEKVLGIENPKVALINIGSEKTKGNELAIKTYEQLEKMNDINFVGNVEGRDIPKGDADVMVCDGFVGNVVLKLMEGMASAFAQIIKEETNKSFVSKMGAALMLPALKGMKKRMDYSEYGGAPLLGVDGISIICHGSSKSQAIHNAIRVAYESYSQGFIDTIKANINMGEVLE
ncbi:MAG: phosphate acyltransferase PlsX [Clostridia bacterium]|nr:phosphate acyltransferase PlsX [Clostridia bacterium]